MTVHGADVWPPSGQCRRSRVTAVVFRCGAETTVAIEWQCRTDDRARWSSGATIGEGGACTDHGATRTTHNARTRDHSRGVRNFHARRRRTVRARGECSACEGARSAQTPKPTHAKKPRASARVQTPRLPRYSCRVSALLKRPMDFRVATGRQGRRREESACTTRRHQLHTTRHKPTTPRSAHPAVRRSAEARSELVGCTREGTPHTAPPYRVGTTRALLFGVRFFASNPGGWWQTAKPNFLCRHEPRPSARRATSPRHPA